MDKTLNKLCFRIRGSVSSANYVSNSSAVTDLQLSGRYIYTILKKIPNQALTVHYDFVTQKNLSFRITVSTFFSEAKVAGSTLRVPLSLAFPDDIAENNWVIISLDVPSTIKKYAKDSFKTDQIDHLKATR